MIKQVGKVSRHKFNKVTVEVYRGEDGNAYYTAEHVAKAVGYTKTSGIDHHIKDTHYNKNIVTKSGRCIRVLDIDGINYLSVKASRTPLLKLMNDWAFDISYPAADKAVVKLNEDTFEPTVIAANPLIPMKQQYSVNINNDGYIGGFGIVSNLTQIELPFDKKPETVKPKRVRKSRSQAYVPPTEENFGIKESAEKLGLNTVQLSDWLVQNGFAGRYKGNNALYLDNWFKDQGYGLNPVLPADNIGGTRISNVPRITESGIKFITNRLKNERETNLREFNKASNAEKIRLEAKMDELITNTFKDREESPGFGLYWISEKDLIERVKRVVAQVVVK